MSENIEFGCTGCGLCCTKGGEAIEHLKSYGFPFKAKEDGSCEKLLPDGRCGVYDNRPDVCNLSTMHEKYYKQIGVSRKEFYLGNARQCLAWQSEEGVSEKELIDLTKYNK